MITSFVGVKAQAVSLDFVMLFSLLCIVASSIFAALTMGIINTGKEKNGAKYLPVVLAISIAIFYIIRFALETMFGGMLK
jgi:hypothetical protein